MSYRLSKDKELTPARLQTIINKHKADVTGRFLKLNRAYMTKYDIFNMDPKPEWKPDNRLAVNFAKYIVDTMNGFFLGIPIKTTSADEQVAEYIEFLNQYNDQDNKDSEIGKMCDMYGIANELYYVDEAGHVCTTYVSPLESFMITDDSVLERERYFVRMWIDDDKVMHGSVSDEHVVRYFTNQGGIKFEAEEYPHGFDGVPATEFKENDEKIGLYEPVMSLIDAYNKAISEKANDIDYFADSYLKILGAKLVDEDLLNIRKNRIINMEGMDTSGLDVDFLAKPDAGTTQEAFLDRLERLIYQVSMVANISDENFGAASGLSLKYKLQGMSNLAKTKENKFKSALNRRYKLIFSNPASPVKEDDWVKLNYQFTQNYPANILEESEIAKNLAGITSRETQLKVLSIVDDVQAEMTKIEEDLIGSDDYMTDYPTARS